MGLQKLLHHRNKNHTDFEPKKLTKNFNFSSSNPVPSHSTIFYVSLFRKKGVKYDVKESIFVSSHDGLASNSKKMPVAMRCQIKKQKSGAL